jgi:hypothetical protein
MADGFGDLTNIDQQIIDNLPELLRSRCCPPTEPWVSTDTHDHGHTNCYFMNLAADEIERLRAEVSESEDSDG